MEGGIVAAIGVPVVAILYDVLLREATVGGVVETVLRKVEVEHLVPCVPREVRKRVYPAEIRVNVRPAPKFSLCGKLEQ